jgi:competence protein ComEA
MTFRSWLRVVLWSALVGSGVAIAIFLAVDRWGPDTITIEPGLAGPIEVVIDGAVASPGVYPLDPGARLHQAIDAAGGLAADADVSGINLAGRIGDGERVTIPHLQVDTPPLASPGSPDGASGEHLIDINTAGIAELDQLPGIGPVIAQRIVDFRDIHGPFDSIDQLEQVEGISIDMIDSFRHLVTIDD